MFLERGAAFLYSFPQPSGKYMFDFEFSKASAGEAERSGKREYCAAFNEALPVQQRLEALPKVCALVSAFSRAHIQRAPLNSAHR